MLGTPSDRAAKNQDEKSEKSHCGRDQDAATRMKPGSCLTDQMVVFCPAQSHSHTGNGRCHLGLAMDHHSDLEELLEDSPAPQRAWSFPSRVLLVLGLVAVAGLALRGSKGVGLRSKSGSFVGLDALDGDEADGDGAEVSTCFQAGGRKLDATERTVEFSAELCQQRCQVVPECSHFTFWPDGGCLLTGEASYTKAAPMKYSETMTGPKFCPGAVQAAQEAIAAAKAGSGLQQADASGLQDSTDAVDAGLHTAAAASSGLQQFFVHSGIKQAESNWGAADDAQKTAVAAVTPGINGTTCSAYPACVDVGIKDGNCCPNADNVILGCCNGFPKTLEQVTIEVGTECSNWWLAVLRFVAKSAFISPKGDWGAPPRTRSLGITPGPNIDPLTWKIIPTFRFCSEKRLRTYRERVCCVLCMAVANGPDLDRLGPWSGEWHTSSISTLEDGLCAEISPRSLIKWRLPSRCGPCGICGSLPCDASEVRMGTWTANLFQSILDTRREKYGDENPKTLTSMTHMGGILEKRGHLKGALDHYGEAMHIRRDVLGDKHPKTLQSIGKMASMCKQQGQTYEALILAQEALFGSKKAFGEQAPDTLDALNNLGSAWKAQGDYKEAEKCFRDAFKLRHESLGPKHPDTLTSLNNLACTVDALGRPSEAGKLYQELGRVGDRGGFAGAKVAGQRDRSMAYWKYSEVIIGRFFECLERRRGVLGHSHPDTMTSMSNLALYLKTNGQTEKAFELFEQVLDGRRKIFGIKHMDTIISMNNLASMQKDLAEEYRRKYDDREEKKALDKAHSLLKEAVFCGRQHLGKRHPVTLKSINNLAGVMRTRGDLEKAKELYEKAVQGMRDSLGDKHLDTLLCLNNLAGVLRSVNEIDDAEECYKEAAAGIVEKLGDRHPTSVSTLYNWGLTLDEKGDFSSAVPLYLHELDHAVYAPEQRMERMKNLSERLRKDSKKKDELVISCLRSLAMDAVQQANSGHPGTPMAMAPVAYALWARILNYDPDSPQWMNRDRFVLSMGHASMLLYGLLHVAGVKEMTQEGHSTEKTLGGKTVAPCNAGRETIIRMAVSLDDIRNFRQLGSRCPGHPEFGETGGVEMTTGPLGQGVATSVGMAMASKWFASTFNKPDFPLFGFDVFALAGDGCLQD
eukprot:s1164_g5.t3